MIPGLNHNVRYRDRVFHVQTEDKGLEKALLTTHVFIEGSVIAERHESYFDLGADQLEINSRNAAVRKRMQGLHKDCMKALLRGDFDDTIYRLGVMPRPTEEAPVSLYGGPTQVDTPAIFPPGLRPLDSPILTIPDGIALTIPDAPALSRPAPPAVEPSESITGPVALSSPTAPTALDHAVRVPPAAAPVGFMEAPRPNLAELTASTPARPPVGRADAFSPESTVIAARPPRRDAPRSDDFGAEPTIIAARPPRLGSRSSPAPEETPTLVGVSMSPELVKLFPDGLPALDSLPPLGVSSRDSNKIRDPATADLPQIQAAREPSFTDDLILPTPSSTKDVAPPSSFASEPATDLVRRPDLAALSRPATMIDPLSDPSRSWPGAIPPSPVPDQIFSAPSRRSSVSRDDLDVVEVDVVEDDALADLEVVIDEPPIELGPESVVDDTTSTMPGVPVMLPSFGPRPEIRKTIDRPGSFTRLPTMPPPAADMKELFHRISKPVPGPLRPAHAVRIPERSLDDIILGYLSGEREGEK
ncbi:MAG: hypothetical protein HY791_22265 [Deltaproteobacteria bacterium]|nr:hypothetical protein [Deltaproteobacteria bacterium]